MAVAALFGLKHQGAASLERRPVVEIALRQWCPAPGIHLRRPWSVGRELGKRAQDDGEEQDGENCDGPAPPALLAFAREKREQQEHPDTDDRSNQQERSLKLRRKQREQSVQPQEKEIRARNRLDNCRIGLAGRSKGSKDDGAEGYRQQDATGKDQVLPDRVRHEGHTVLVSQFLVLLQVSLAL